MRATTSIEQSTTTTESKSTRRQPITSKPLPERWYFFLICFAIAIPIAAVIFCVSYIFVLRKQNQRNRKNRNRSPQSYKRMDLEKGKQLKESRPPSIIQKID